MPRWAQNGGYVLLVGCLLAICGAIYWGFGHKAARYDGTYLAIALLWGVGVSCKVASVGPDFFRYWLADVGFPLFIGWGLWEMFYGAQFKRLRRESTSHSVTLALLKRRVYQRKAALLAAVGGSYVFELVVGLTADAMRAENPNVRSGAGGFDWFDILAYTVGGLLGWWLLACWGRFLDRFTEDAAHRDADEAVGVAQQAAAARAQAERDRRVRKKRGKKP